MDQDIIDTTKQKDTKRQIMMLLEKQKSVKRICNLKGYSCISQANDNISAVIYLSAGAWDKINNKKMSREKLKITVAYYSKECNIRYGPSPQKSSKC